jgi:hypothetical protein
MNDAYDYKIGANEFDPETSFHEIITLGHQISKVLQEEFTPDQEATFEAFILNCLACMVYGSNMIERAGSGREITLKLCMAIFSGEKVSVDVRATEEEFMELKHYPCASWLIVCFS